MLTNNIAKEDFSGYQYSLSFGTDRQTDSQTYYLLLLFESYVLSPHTLCNNVNFCNPKYDGKYPI